MDHREDTQHERNRYKTELEEQKDQEIDFDKQYIEENGSKFRVPYRNVRKVLFTNVSQSEMRDIEHAARLQYRLMLMDPILKATVNFTKQTITITFNPLEAENLKEKTSVPEIVKFLADQGVHVDAGTAKEEDYDYVSTFYNYAFNPPSIREHPPYGYTKKEWEKIKPKWEEKSAKAIKDKFAKYRQFQKDYDEKIWAMKNPEAAAAKAKEDEKNRSLVDKILGRKKSSSGGKAFWFHGI